VWNRGTARIDEDAVELSAVQLASAGGFARLDGRYGWVDGAARLEAAWRGVALPKSWQQSGTLSISASAPWPGQRRVEATLQGQADGPGANHVRMRAQLNGAGKGWNEVDWTLVIPQLRWELGRRAAEIAGLRLGVAVRGPVVTLSSLSLDQGGTLAGRGQADFTTRKWSLAFEARDIPLPLTA